MDVGAGVHSPGQYRPRARCAIRQTTSCTLAGALNNSGRLVSVEPDGSVHAALLANRASHWCNFHLLNGTVSLRPHAMLEQDADARDVDGKYGTRFRTAASEFCRF